MKKYLKKLSFKTFVISSLGLFCFIYMAKPIKASETVTFSYLTTSIGENETSIGINYHSNVDGTQIMYSTSSNFSVNKEIADVTSTIWSKEQMSSDPNTGFSDRYVCSANLNNLKENTTYYYRAFKGNAYSKTMSFKTGSNSNKNVSFLFGTDIHASAGYNTTSQTNNVLSTLVKKYQNIKVAILTGDQVDRGGYESEWKAFYNGMTVFDNIIQASIPGNHEYYHSKQSQYVSAEIYNQFYNNPKNGPDVRKNSSYYFKYGNVLVIMLDIIKMSDTSSVPVQKAWFKEVVKNNPAEWIIVGTHAGAVTAGNYKSDAAWINNNWRQTFEECQVDLCLSGHEHIYIRRDLYYQNNPDEQKGLTYLVGCASGHKSYASSTKDKTLSTKMVNYAANIITVTENSLNVKLLDENGNIVLDSSNKKCEFTLSPKRPSSITKMSDQEILDSINLNYDPDEITATFSWNESLYGNISQIDFESVINDETIKDNTKKISRIIAAPFMNSYDFLAIYPHFNYTFNLTLYKQDGTTISKVIPLVNRKSYNIELNTNGGTLKEGEEINSYTEGNTTFLPVPTKEGYAFGGWYKNNSLEGEGILKIMADETGDLSLYAKWNKIYNITYIADGFDTSSFPQTYIETKPQQLPTLEKEGTEFGGWYLTNDFKGDSYLSTTVDLTGDITLYARFLKESNIKYVLNKGTFESDPQTTYKEGIQTNLPTPERKKYIFDGWYLDSNFEGEKITNIEKYFDGDITLYAKWSKKGCKKQIAVIEILSAITLLSFVLRKKN